MKKILTALVLTSLYASISFAQTMGFGSMGGSFAVNDMGAATYTIPIDVPQGINGMQPNVALTYNSQSGNGVCGLGFSIAASSAITRTAKDVYYDGVARGIKYDSSDAYALDGIRLITMSANTYTPSDAPFDIVTKNEQGFVVKLQNGNTAYYGQTTDSRAIAGGETYAWYLNKVEDTHGNSMTYRYIADNGSVYLQQISYGANSKSASGLTNTVAFTYEDRTDIMPFNVNGVRCEMKKRLKTIQTKTNGTLRNTYTLNYTNTDNFSKLTTISAQYGTMLLPQITLAWGSCSGQMTSYKTSGISLFDEDQLSFDINGDGLSDILSIDYSSVTIYNAQKSGNEVSFGKSKTISISGSSVSKKSAAIADVNGDIIADLILVTKKSGGETIQKISDGIYTFNVGTDEMLFGAGDFFNNGKSGLIYLKKESSGNTRCKLMQFDSKNQTQNLSAQLTLPNLSQVVKVSDFDGDGMEDLLVAGRSGYTIFWNNGVASNVFPFSDSNKTERSTFAASDIMDYGDFDGDGLLDILSVDNSGSKNIGGKVKLSYEFYIYSNNGNGNFTKNRAYSDYSIVGDNISPSKMPTVCEVVDINNDGKSDILLEYPTEMQFIENVDDGDIKPTNSTNYIRVLAISKGNKFALHRTNLSSYQIFGGIVQGDFDGDGKEELLMRCDDLLDRNVKSNGKRGLLPIDTYIYDNVANEQSKRLIQISEAQNGKKTQMSYSTLSNKNVYTQGKSSATQTINITIPMSVVSQVKEIVADKTYTTNYKYEGLRAHMQGFGILGFTSTEAENINLGVKRKTTIKALHSTYLGPTQIVTTTTQGGKTSSVETTLGYAGKTSRSYFGYTASVRQTDIYGDMVTTQNTYNTSYGYLTKQRTEYGGSSMYKQMEYQSFVKVGGVYRPQTTIITQKHADASDVFSQKTTYIYSSITGDVTQMTENAATKPVIHKYTYDVFGNVLTHTTSADGIPTVTATNTYDATHRFVATKKSSANSITSTFTYNIHGLLKQSVQTAGSVSLKTTYTYDDLGNIATIIHPDSTKTTYTRGWGSSAQKRHYIKEQRTAAAPITKWFDNAGREVESSTTGEKGIALSSKNTYNDTFGTIASATSSVGTLSLTNTYTYDNLGMLKQVNYGSGSTATFSYARRQHSTTFAGMRTTTQTLDAWGGVKTVTDGMITACNYTYASNGRPTSVKYADQSGQNNTETTMAYNALGQQTQLTDPDAGTTKYEYDALGRIVKQTDARGNVTKNTYNAAGLITNQTCGNFTTNYTYTATQKLSSESANNTKIQYSYDNLDRLTQKTYTIDGTTMPFIYTYNANGQIVSKTRPDAVTETYTYDANGNVTSISINGTKVWELISYTGRQRVMKLGKITLTKSYSAQGRLTSSEMNEGNTRMHSMSYTYDNATGNITRRTGVSTYAETFTYDSFDRLTSATTNGQTKSVSYSLNGNIRSKTGIGAYSYNKARPHAVTQVTNVDKLIRQTAQTVTYNAFNKASKITQGETTLTIEYGPNRKRSKTTYSEGKNTSITLYAGEYERRTEKGTTSGWNYIYSPDGDLVAICKTTNGTTSIYNVSTDNLGTIVCVYNSKYLIDSYLAEYDAWGKRTVKRNALGLRRGYCQHEHWDEFDLIDMNGRMYDPSVGRFLSPDPYVQNATNPQNFNRYSYCLNNPLKYTDPSGMQHQQDMNDAGFSFDDDKRDSDGGGYGGYGSNVYSYYDQNGNWAMSPGTQAEYNYLLSGGFVSPNTKGETVCAAPYLYKQTNNNVDWFIPIPIYTDNDYNDRYSGRGGGSGGKGGTLAAANTIVNAAATSGKQTSTVLSGTGLGMTIMGLGVGKQQAKYAVGKISAARLTQVGTAFSKVATPTIAGLGFVATSFAAYNEYSTGQENYHTYVDVGVAAGALIVTLLCPGAALAIGLFTLGYGICSANGLVDDFAEWLIGHPYKRDEDY